VGGKQPRSHKAPRLWPALFLWMRRRVADETGCNPRETCYMTETMRKIPSRFTLERQRTIGLDDLCTHHLARESGRPLFVGDASRVFKSQVPAKAEMAFPVFGKKLCKNKEM
jgi:hypothetical protein